MCGIVGIYRTDGEPARTSNLGGMLDMLRHRGPDGSGACAHGPIAIGMTRLAIIDVAGGQQPIYNEAGTIALVCNGEIYNCQLLREELERAGHRFRTHSDVEVILHLYEDVGEACFSRLNGMFGAAIADFRTNHLVLGRDPFGQKSLYLWRSPTGWAFASELKALTGHPLFTSRISSEALAGFLQFRYVPAPLTIFEGVEKLPPGSYAVLSSADAPRISRYFQMDLSPATVGRAEDPTGELTRDALMGSVERHLMSERPLGVFLSGGVDSSALVACMHMSGHRNIHTFSVGFEGFRDNELGVAQSVADHFKTNHHEVLLDPDAFWESLDQVVYSADEPLADLTTIPLYHLAERASRDVVVVLSGEGADELLAGYRDLSELRAMFDLHKRLQPFAPLARTLLPLPFPADIKRKLQTVSSSPADYLSRTRASMVNVFPPDVRRSFRQRALRNGEVFEPLERYYSSRQSWDGVHLYLGCMIEWWLPDDLLHKADRMTMAHSIELRCPFLDVDFAQHCAALGLDSKVSANGGELGQKTALKKAFIDLLPAGLVTRRKKGFSIPAYEWISTVYRERAAEALESDDALGNGVMVKSERLALFERAVAGDLISQRRVWSLIVLNKWGERWM